MYSSTGLPNPPAPQHPRVKIVSIKYFLRVAIQSGAYGDITWIGVLQPNIDTSEYRATEHASCGLAAHATLEATESAAGNMAERTTYGAMYHSTGEIAISSIEHTIYSVLPGSKSNQLALE